MEKNEYTDYLREHKEVIDSVALAIEKGQSVPAEDVVIYSGYMQLKAVFSSEMDAKVEEISERLRLQKEYYQELADYSKEHFDTLVKQSLEMFENAK